MKLSLEKLINGYRRFRDDNQKTTQLLNQLSKAGQKPEAMIIACADSRVDPAILFQCDPGDLFVVRNVANLVPPFEQDSHHHGTSAALEFGVCYLHVKHVIVMGHSQCGGIQARLNPESLEGQNDFLGNWTSLIDIEHAKEKTVDCCAKHSLENSEKNLLTFPWIKERVNTGTLQIHLWFFDIATATVQRFDKTQQKFIPLI